MVSVKLLRLDKSPVPCSCAIGLGTLASDHRRTQDFRGNGYSLPLKAGEVFK